MGRISRAIAGCAILLAGAVILAAAEAPRADGAYPGVNGKIAFQSNRGGNEDIFVSDPDGSGQVALAPHPAVDEYPEWSADGKSLVFTSKRGVGNTVEADSEVFRMAADGSSVTQLTDQPGNEYQPAFSPDGSRIAFASDRTGNQEVFVMLADGSLQSQLTFEPGVDSQPTWSPDGSRLAFSSNRAGNMDIWVMNANGSNPTRLTTSSLYEADGDWSPDGSKILYAADLTGFGDFDIFVVNADGSGTPLNVTNKPGWDSFPTWSPDGTKIAFHSLRDGNWAIYTANADGTAQNPVPGSPASEVIPSWQPLPPTVPPQPSSPQPVAPVVASPPPPPAKPRPRILGARVKYRFSLGGDGFQVLRLAVTNVTRGSRVTISCSKGCSLRQGTVVRGTTQSFTALFRGRKLPFGSTIVVRVTKAGFIGRYFRYSGTSRRLLGSECRIAVSGKLTNCTKI